MNKYEIDQKTDLFVLLRSTVQHIRWGCLPNRLR